MNARLLLLALVTGMFMAAWDGDQAAMEVALAKQIQRQHELRVARATRTSIAPGADSGAGAYKPVSLKSGPAVEQSRTMQVIRIEIPLPAGITVGTYHAVNQMGQSQEITVAGDRATGRVDRDFYTVDALSGDRWYLIRIVE